MDIPVVIGGFVAIDAMLGAQTARALKDLRGHVPTSPTPDSADEAQRRDVRRNDR